MSNRMIQERDCISSVGAIKRVKYRLESMNGNGEQ